jgi:hypothetical protein
MSPRKVGRPRGTVRLTEPWNPKKWKPLYDSILALAVTGLKNTVIAETLKIDKQTVYLVLSSPAGSAKLAELQRLKQNAVKDTIEKRMAALHDKALQRVETFINNNEIAENAPVKMFDRSLQVLRGLGAMKQEAPSDPASVQPLAVTNNTINVVADRELLGQLNVGVAKALEAAKLHESAFTKLTRSVGAGDKATS